MILSKDEIDTLARLITIRTTEDQVQQWCADLRPGTMRKNWSGTATLLMWRAMDTRKFFRAYRCAACRDGKQRCVRRYFRLCEHPQQRNDHDAQANSGA